MLFNSVAFFILLILVLPAYFLLPHKYRWILLLGASFYFYMCWRWDYVFLILTSSLIDYVAGVNMIGASRKRMKICLIASMAGNLGLLFAFKYFNLFNSTLTWLGEGFGFENPVSNLNVLLPVGISFYTFQAMSYTIDIYRDKMQPTRHIGKYLLFVMFFPQLVAGPIERASHLLNQFNRAVVFNHARFCHGMMYILWGLFEKTVIADNACKYVDMVYNDPVSFGGHACILATYIFAIQIYCDFAGYSNIAIGAAEILGINVMQNFKRPYLGKTFQEVWGSRWHISLSTWLRDYLYISLGGNRLGIRRTYVNIFLTMLLGGIWHGANWTFLLWGLYVGIFISLSKMYDPYRDKIPLLSSLPPLVRRIWQSFVTFQIMCVSWIIFRSNNFDSMYIMFKKIFTLTPSKLDTILTHRVYQRSEFLFLLAMILMLFVIQIIQEKQKSWALDFLYTNANRVTRWAFYLFLVFVIILFGNDGSVAFIYFQF
jgi:alginate O-acetyltransferase complex protein AlgI